MDHVAQGIGLRVVIVVGSWLEAAGDGHSGHGHEQVHGVMLGPPGAVDHSMVGPRLLVLLRGESQGEWEASVGFFLGGGRKVGDGDAYMQGSVACASEREFSVLGLRLEDDGGVAVCVTGATLQLCLTSHARMCVVFVCLDGMWSGCRI